MSAKKRLSLRFTGTVQGVGFRYTAYHAAQALGVTGWVRNEGDGSVSMQAQGTPEAISALLSQLEDAAFIGIDAVEEAELPVEEHEARFSVRY